MYQVCIRCGETKASSDFYHRDRTCKECRKRLVRENRAQNAEYYREYDRERFQNDPRVKARHAAYAATDNGKARLAAGKKRWAERNPEKRLAHHTLNNAVRSGKILKPKVCSQCRRRRRIQAHHHDYTKPLVVEWLCVECHSARHHNKER